MSTTANSTSAAHLEKLHLSRRWAWLGPIAGIACMIALLITGWVTHSQGLMVMAGSLIPVFGVIWACVDVSLHRQIDQAERAQA